MSKHPGKLVVYTSIIKMKIFNSHAACKMWFVPLSCWTASISVTQPTVFFAIHGLPVALCIYSESSLTIWLADILVLRGRAPFGQHQESRPLGNSNFRGMLREFVSYSQPIRLSDLALSMRRVTGSPWIEDFWCWTFLSFCSAPGIGLRGREWSVSRMTHFICNSC